MTPLTVRRSRHDVIVVGARCAGAATAMLLARAGHDVVLVDRSHPARDTNSTHSFARGGVVQLARWGLLDRVVATGAPKITAVSFHRDGEEIRRTVKDRAGVDFLIAPRRYELDSVLASAAVEAGATLMTDTTVTGVRQDGRGRVTGVTARGADGTRLELSASLVIGADGVHSSMAQWFGAEVVESHGPSSATFYTYVAGVPWGGIELHLGDRAYAGVFPTHRDEACVWLIQPEAELDDVMGAGGARLDAWLRSLRRSFPRLEQRIRGGKVTAPLRGSVGLPNQVRRAAGPGWALIGDAGYHRDPITGHGMTDAFRDAELLAEAAVVTLRCPSAEASAMARFEGQRDAALAETFALTVALGAFPPPAEFLDLQLRLSKALDVEAQALAARRAPVGRRDRTMVAGVA